MVFTDFPAHLISKFIFTLQTHLSLAKLERNHAKHVSILRFFLALP